MNQVFWTLVVVDAVLFLVLLVNGLTAPAPRDGGREMGLIFGIILPAVFVAAGVLLYVLSKPPAPRLLALAIVAAPMLLIAGAHLRNAWMDHRIRQHAADPADTNGSTSEP